MVAQLVLGGRPDEPDEGHRDLPATDDLGADDLGQLDGRVQFEASLDLGRGDQEAAQPEAVADAGEELEPAVGGEPAEVAGAEPAVPRQRPSRRLGVAEVAAQHDRPADAQLALLPDRAIVAGVGIDDPQLGAAPTGMPPERARSARLIVVGHLVSSANTSDIP